MACFGAGNTVLLTPRSTIKVLREEDFEMIGGASLLPATLPPSWCNSEVQVSLKCSALLVGPS